MLHADDLNRNEVDPAWLRSSRSPNRSRPNPGLTLRDRRNSQPLLPVIERPDGNAEPPTEIDNRLAPASKLFESISPQLTFCQIGLMSHRSVLGQRLQRWLRYPMPQEWLWWALTLLQHFPAMRPLPVASEDVFIQQCRKPSHPNMGMFVLLQQISTFKPLGSVNPIGLLRAYTYVCSMGFAYWVASVMSGNG